MSPGKLKFYCFVDETGQDARSSQFVVAVIAISSIAIDQARVALADLEKTSGKREKKWIKSTISVRRTFWQGLVGIGALQGCVFVKRFPKSQGRQDYLGLTIETIRQALTVAAASSPMEATVIVDGLQKPLYRTVRVGASSPPAIRVRKVRGLPEESDEFLRLADAVAGCARASSEGIEYARGLYEAALTAKLVLELE